MSAPQTSQWDATRNRPLTITKHLPEANIIVGSPLNYGEPVALSGDATINSAGVLTLIDDVVLGGSPTTTTQPPNTGNLSIATTEYVDAAAATSLIDDQDITPAGALVLPHGLGRNPTSLRFQLVCQSDELGYTAGQVIAFGGCMAISNGGYSAILDSTNLTIRFGSSDPTFTIPHATTGVSTSITNSNWKIRFYAQ